jgi:hypothetical protein
VVAHFLKLVGWLYQDEAEPVMNTIKKEKTDKTMRVRCPYFHKPDPIRFNTKTVYSDNQTTLAVT